MGRWRHWVVPLLLLGSSLSIALLGEEAGQLLRYQRVEIIAGQWWRLATGHLVHLGWAHLWMNIGGLLLVWLLVGRALSLVQWGGLLAFCMLGISLGLLWWLPQLDWYVGLSGVLHGMLLAAALQLALGGDREALLISIIVTLKVAYEMGHGPLPGSREAAGGEVVYQAHALGCLCAALFVAVQRLARRFSA